MTSVSKASLTKSTTPSVFFLLFFVSLFSILFYAEHYIFTTYFFDSENTPHAYHIVTQNDFLFHIVPIKFIFKFVTRK